MNAPRVSRPTSWLPAILVPALALAAAASWLVGCKGAGSRLLDQGLNVAADVLDAGGQSEAATGLRVARLGLRSFRDIQTDQEHYIGRSVCAQVLANPAFRVSRNPSLSAYVSAIGQTVALGAESVRETYQGYRFVLLDSPSINAFAAPGGYVFITEGAVRETRNEDELAGILAHEVAHVHLKHGLQAIRESNLTEAGQLLLQEVQRRDQGKLTKVFNASVGDITQTLLHGGFSRKQESEADQVGATFLAEVGYAPQALIEFLQRVNFDGGGFADEHPSASQRVDALRKTVSPGPASATPGFEARRRRHARSAR